MLYAVEQEVTAMLSLIDCLDFIDLDRATIEVIAEHQHLPSVVAAELGDKLIASAKGIYRIHEMHRDLIEKAARTGHLEREKELRTIYAAFTRKYPMPRHL
jgi:hypothetical protein